MAEKNGLSDDPVADWYTPTDFGRADDYLWDDPYGYLFEEGSSRDTVKDDEPYDRVDWAEYLFSEEQEAALYEEEWNQDFQAEPITPSFYGVNRVRVGQIGWWDIDHKEHKTWTDRRRGKGISRAPKWQKFAGGRRKAVRSIKHLPVKPQKMSDIEMLEAFNPLWGGNPDDMYNGTYF